MIKKNLSKIIVLLVFLGLSCFYMIRVQADNSKVTVTADKATASVNVTISDSSLEGKEISVVCYNPQWDGSFTDGSKNQKYIVYLNQYKVSGTTKFSFRVNEQPVKGEYSLVIGSKNGRLIQKFRFFPAETAKPAETTKPEEGKKLSAPKSLKAVQSGATQVRLTWAEVVGAKSYDVYRSAKASSGFKKIGSAAAATYQDKNASAGKTWYYKVAAIGATAAANSNQSSAVKVLVLKAPSISTKSTAKGRATVSWKKVKGAKGYEIFTSAKKSGKYKKKLTLKGAAKVKGTVKNLNSGKTCYIKVRAYTTVSGKKVPGKYSKVKTVKIR